MNYTKLLNVAISGAAIPRDWMYCFNGDCPHHDDCVRYHSTAALDRLHTSGNCVFPTALRDDGSCTHFKQLRIVCVAWGFRRMFDEVRVADAPLLRTLMKGYLGGHGTYYMYNSGKRRLMPKQQEWIRKLFASYGYKNVEFDNSRDEIDFN